MNLQNSLMKLSVCAVVLSVTAAVAGSPMGPPSATLEPGQFGFGVIYGYGDLGLEVEEGRDNAGTPVPGYLADPFTMQTVYGTLSYGLLDRWEVGIHAGIAWGEWDLPGNQLEADIGPYVGGYTRVTFFQREKFKLGGVAQVGWCQTEGDNWGPGWRGDTELEFFRLRVGLGAVYEFTERFSVYAGPLFQYLDGQKRYDQTLPAAGYWEEYDVEARSNWGGFFGAEAKLSDHVRLGADFQLTPRDWIAGLSLRWLW